jgi:TonB family protein
VAQETVAPSAARQAQLSEVIEQERSQNQAKTTQTKPQSLSQQQKEDTPDGEIESRTKQNESQFQSSLRKDLQRGQGNYFGQGKFGSMTALNTDRFEGFSFYRRVEESTRSRWDDHVENAINQLRRHSQTSILSQPTWTTQVEFLLDREGNLRKAYVVRSSGLVPFDVAATQAFKDAATFPNPPRELIADDGFIHLNFIFNVHLNPGLAARGSE